MLIRVLIFCALLTTCKGTDSWLKLTEKEIQEIQKHHAGADVDLAIDPGFNLHVSASHFLPAEPGELIGATVELESQSNIHLGAPDASGLASPTAGWGGAGEMPTGKWLRVDLKNHDGQLCKVVVKNNLHTGIIFQLYRPGAELKDDTGVLVRDQVLYTSYPSSDADDTNRICIDDKIVPMRTLNAVIGTYGVGGSLPEESLQERVNTFKVRHKEFLETDSDRDDVGEFMLRAKMLDGHFALRDKIGDEYENDDLIRSVLGAFVSDKHNIMPSEEILQDGDSTTLKMTKTAVAGAVSRFLMYQQVFNADDFAVAKFNDDFDNIEWHVDLSPMVASIKDNYPANTAGMKTFSSASDLRDSLIQRIYYMNTYMRKKIKDDSEASDDSEGGGCETHVEMLFQGIQNPELYVDTLKKADAGFNLKTFEAKIGDVEGMLLLTKMGLIKTKLHEVCKQLDVDLALVPIANDVKHGNPAVIKMVEALKSSVLKTLKDFNDKYTREARKTDENYLPNLIRKRLLALPPVFTFSDNNNVDEVVDPLIQANKENLQEKDRNKFWNGIREGFAKVVGIIGIVAVVAGLIGIVFPPALGVASFAAMISLAGTALLVPAYTVEWMQERSDYHSLESSILSGGSVDFNDQIEHLNEFRSARNEALLSGAFVALGAVPVARFARNPRALLTSPKDMAKGIKNIWGTSTRPFTWAGKTAWGTIRHPIQTAKNIPNNARKGWKGIREGISNARASVQGLKKQKITGATAVTAKKFISDTLKGGATRIKNFTRDVWRVNVSELKKYSTWKAVRNMRKANKDMRNVKFRLRSAPLSSGEKVSSTWIDIKRVDGKEITKELQEQIREKVLQATKGKVPGGDNKLMFLWH